MNTQSNITPRPPRPPFTFETATQKVRLAEDGWNSRDPESVAQAYALDSRWRNRAEFVNGRQEIVAFLTRKWAKELDYRLIKELWAFHGNRIAVRFAYEWHDDSGNWYRSYGNENSVSKPWPPAKRGMLRHSSGRRCLYGPEVGPVEDDLDGAALCTPSAGKFAWGRRGPGSATARK